MIKMRTRKPAASADSGKAIHSETATHTYITAQVAKNPPNDVESCTRLRANIGDWKGAHPAKSGSICGTIAPTRGADEPVSEDRPAPRRCVCSRRREIPR